MVSFDTIKIVRLVSLEYFAVSKIFFQPYYLVCDVDGVGITGDARLPRHTERVAEEFLYHDLGELNCSRHFLRHSRESFKGDGTDCE